MSLHLWKQKLWNSQWKNDRIKFIFICFFSMIILIACTLSSCDWWNPENSWFEFHCFSKRRPSKHFASTSLASWGFNPLKHIDWIHLIVYQTKVVVLIPSASMWWDERKMSWNECMKQCSILRCTKWSITIIRPYKITISTLF